MSPTFEGDQFPARVALERLLTPDDLVGLLRVTTRTISRLCLKGELPQPIKLGGGNRWHAEEIHEALGVMKRRGKK